MTGWDTRAQAGLRAPRAISTNVNPTAGVGCHYGGGGPFKRSDHDACRAIWRSWQDYHMSPSNSNNYIDIAYNLGACHHDIVLEGRSTRTRPIVRGGANGNATVNYNRYSVVAIWGSNDGDWPDSLKRAWRHGRDWLRQQDRRTGTGLTPHRDMSSTACPGGPGTTWFRAGAPLPGGTPSQEDDMNEAELLAGLGKFFGANALTYNDAPMSRDMALQRSVQWSGGNSNALKYRVEPALAALRAEHSDDPAAIAAELAPLVIPPVVAAVGAFGGLTPEQVEEATEKAIRDVLREGVGGP